MPRAVFGISTIWVPSQSIRSGSIISNHVNYGKCSVSIFSCQLLNNEAVLVTRGLLLPHANAKMLNKQIVERSYQQKQTLRDFISFLAYIDRNWDFVPKILSNKSFNPISYTDILYFGPGPTEGEREQVREREREREARESAQTIHVARLKLVSSYNLATNLVLCQTPRTR